MPSEKGACNGECFLLDGRVGAEAVQPVDAGLVPEPGHLTLGVLPRLGLAFTNGALECEFTGDDLNGLFVAQRLKRLGVRREAGVEKSLGLLEKPGVKHSRGTPVEALAEEAALGCKPELQDGEALKAITRRGLNSGCGLACQEGQL